jgi:four helix bundle protein
MSKSLICDRAFEFSSRVIRVCDVMWRQGPISRHLATQLLRCATSIGANAEEAQEAQTKADFIAKLSVSRKEAREAIWWLRLIVGNGYANPTQLEWETSEARQLLAMIRSAILTARSSSNRGAHPDD